MKDIFSYRFSGNGSLAKHSLGNLIMTALMDITKSESLAIKKASEILKITGNVLPVSLDKCHLHAKLEDGQIIEGETNIDIPKHNPELRIEEVFLNKGARLYSQCKNAIKNADLIVIGPGDLYTSIIPNLLVDGMKEAIKASKAKKIYICNLMTKYGETNNFKASDFLKIINRYLGSNVIDFIILNKEKPSTRLLEFYKGENAELVKNDISELNKLKVRIIATGLLDRERNILWEKENLLRHDSNKLAETIISLR